MMSGACGTRCEELTYMTVSSMWHQVRGIDVHDVVEHVAPGGETWHCRACGTMCEEMMLRKWHQV